MRHPLVPADRRCERLRRGNCKSLSQGSIWSCTCTPSCHCCAECAGHPAAFSRVTLQLAGLFVHLLCVTCRTHTGCQSSRHRGQKTGHLNTTNGSRSRSGNQPHSLNGRQQNRCKAATADTTTEHCAGQPSTLSPLPPESAIKICVPRIGGTCAHRAAEPAASMDIHMSQHTAKTPALLK